MSGNGTNVFCRGGSIIVRVHSLTSDETVVVFTTPARESLFQDLDHKRNLQRQFLSRLHDALTHDVPRTFVEKPFAGVQYVQQFRAGDVMRGYCVYADEPPEYNVFYVLQVTDHEYDRTPIRRYDRDAGDVLAELRNLETVAETEQYLDRRDAHDAESVRQILERL